jgi:hypothetical protein
MMNAVTKRTAAHAAVAKRRWLEPSDFGTCEVSAVWELPGDGCGVENTPLCDGQKTSARWARGSVLRWKRAGEPS